MKDFKDELNKHDKAYLRNFNELEIKDSINGALKLRKDIERIIDEVWDKFDAIYFVGIGGTYASSHQVVTYLKGLSTLPIYLENASEFLTIGNKRFTDKSLVIISSVSGNTKEMIDLVNKVHELNAKVFAFIDTANSELTKMSDYLIVYPKNEQLKFYMVANYLMYKNHEFDDYEDYYLKLDKYLADALIKIEKDVDEFAYNYALNKCKELEKNNYIPHYFIGSGNLYGMTYSHAMCYWEEQLWIHTKSISCEEFFHGCFEIIEEDTPVTLFIGEDKARSLALRVKQFLPNINKNHLIIDSKDYALDGIDDKYRGSLSFLIIRTILNRIDTYMELFLNHDMNIRRYYRKFEY